MSGNFYSFYLPSNSGGGGGSGTVTSVAMTAPSFLSVAGSPITTSGTLALTLSGTALPIANGGTGQTTASTAINALLPSQTSNSGKFLTTDGSVASWATAGGGGSTWNATKLASSDAHAQNSFGTFPAIYGDSILATNYMLSTTDVPLANTTNFGAYVALVAGDILEP